MIVLSLRETLVSSQPREMIVLRYHNTYVVSMQGNNIRLSDK